MSTNGIHHVTTIARSARRNLDFYTRVLGLRLVKKTVNFDDPSTYHLYYGDETGQPGAILTFFPWAHVAPGQSGTGETQETLFRVPEGSIGFWAHRFVAEGVEHRLPEKRFGETLLAFKDADGMRLALVAVAGIDSEPAWTRSAIAAEHAIRGFHSLSLMLADAAPTGAILSDVLGFSEIGREGPLIRYKSRDTAIGGIVDLHTATDVPPSQQGAGSVHHIAFRAPDDAAQSAMVEKLADNHAIRTTEQKDRTYFRSVYFREPGHILFEIATDSPGFAVDEPAGALGEALKLPRFLENSRSRIEAALPDIGPLPSAADSAA